MSQLEHDHFACVRTRRTADLKSSTGPIFTYIEADGQLCVNTHALKARAAERRARGETPKAVSVPAIVLRGPWVMVRFP